MKTNIRWMIRRDMPEVLEIEDQSFSTPWTHDEFVLNQRRRNTIGVVCEGKAERGEAYGTIQGFMLYALHKSKLEIVNFAVGWPYRRHGVGTAMIRKLKGKLSKGRRTRLVVEVRETNLDAQLFFKAMGFRARCVIADPYEIGEDAYLFEHRLACMEAVSANL